MEKTGSVTLVGAGCGRDLITVKGLSVLQSADVVIYDDLIDGNLLLETKPDCERIYVGKRMGRHSKSQEEIHALLAKKAKEGRQVVRLKGGDSFVFGRGGEEILYLQKEGVPCKVIPGVTSAVAVPEHAGIPVTHRGLSQSVTIITGHSASGKEENYQALAALDGTLVFLMGLSRIQEITEKLLANGKQPKTPAAIISRGYTADEKRIDGTLADIAQKAGEARTPAVLVVGQAAGLDLAQRSPEELAGVSVTVTGTEAFVKKACQLLSGLGAEVDGRPCLQVIPDAENIPDALDDFTWLVFTSANGVAVFFKELSLRKTDLRRLSGLKFACIGSGTADKLKEYGIYADFCPAVFTAQKLGEGLVSKLEAAQKPGEKVLILRAKDGSPDLTAELAKGGILFEDAAIYHTEIMAERIQGFCAETDYMVFGSAHGVETFLERGDLSSRTVPVCIGPGTARALEKKRPGIRSALPEQYTIKGIAEAIAEDRKRKKQKEMRLNVR